MKFFRCFVTKTKLLWILLGATRDCIVCKQDYSYPKYCCENHKIGNVSFGNEKLNLCFIAIMRSLKKKYHQFSPG